MRVTVRALPGTPCVVIDPTCGEGGILSDRSSKDGFGGRVTEMAGQCPCGCGTRVGLMKSGFAKGLDRVQTARGFIEPVLREYLEDVDVVAATRNDLELHMQVGAELERHFRAHVHGTATPSTTPDGMALKRALDPWEARSLSFLKQLGGGG